VKRLRSDNGGEDLNEEFRSLMLKNQIKHEQSAPYSPHQNGTAERAWRSLFDMARCLLIGAELPKQLWSLRQHIYATDATAIEQVKLLMSV